MTCGSFKAITRWGLLGTPLLLLASCSLSLEFRECETSVDCPAGRVCTVDHYCIIEGEGDPTNIITTNCPSGSYGPQCLPCECVGGTCDDGGVGDGSCTCDTGWEGDLCDRCAEDFYGESCTACDCEHGTCDDEIEGTGTCSCDSNWDGVACDECTPGNYGPNCVPCGCEKGTCDEGLSGTGECTCDTGWEGTLCDRCAVSFFGATCQPCDCGTGACSDGLAGTGDCNCDSHFTGPNCGQCANGWTGGACNMCAPNWKLTDGECDECAAGNYGSTCVACSCENGTCDEGVAGNGFCACNTGWSGNSCSECASNYFGDTCAPCDCVNGACVDGLAGNGQCNCSNSWTGDDCSTCPDNWQGGTDCDACTDGWFNGTAPCSGQGDTFEVWVEPGTFTMGSPEDELARGSNEQEHSVTLTKGFYIANHELTQAEWKALGLENPTFYSPECDNCSVDGITWYDAVRFANLKSSAQGFTECYTVMNCFNGIGEWSFCDEDVQWNMNCNGFRLPTEAEWEYAIRAGSETALHNGEFTVSGFSSVDPNLGLIGWYYVNKPSSHTQEVMGLAPNAWGIYDMSGNAREWVWDWYMGDYGSDSQTDPAESVAPEGEFAPIRVWRGGSWWDNAEVCRSANRGGREPHSPGDSNDPMGFRLVRSVSP